MFVSTGEDTLVSGSVEVAHVFTKSAARLLRRALFDVDTFDTAYYCNKEFAILSNNPFQKSVYRKSIVYDGRCCAVVLCSV